MWRLEPTLPRRLRFTLAFLAVMLVANAASGTFAGQLDPDVLRARGIGVDALQDGEMWRFVTAIFLSHDLPMLLRQLAFAGIVIGLTERRCGSLRAAGLFFGLDVATTVVLLAVVAATPALATLAATTDVGMSLGGFGLIGVLAAQRRRPVAAVSAVLALVAAKYAIAPEPLADAGHVIGLLIGAGVGHFAKGATRPRKPELNRAPARTGDGHRQGGPQ